MNYSELMKTAVDLLRQGIASRYVGGAHVDKVRSQAYADGYLRALVDAELVEERELLALIRRERDQAAADDGRLAVAG